MPNTELIKDILICQGIVIGPDSLYRSKWSKFSNAYHDLDLDPKC